MYKKIHPDRYTHSAIRRTFVTYEVLNWDFIKSAKNGIRCFDNSKRHFDTTKLQNRPLIQLMIGV